MILISDNLKQLPDIAKQILDYSSPHKKFLLYGDMGVGKTTLIKELSLQLGVIDVVSSPTFAIVHEYTSLTYGKICHFDFYRLDSEKEIFDMGLEEYFFDDCYCFVEWPERIISLIEHDMVVINIKSDDEKRVIEIII